MNRRLVCLFLVCAMFFSLVPTVFASNEILNESHSINQCQIAIQSAIASYNVVKTMAKTEENRVYKLLCFTQMYKYIYYMSAISEESLSRSAYESLKQALIEVGPIVNEFMIDEGSYLVRSTVCDGNSSSIRGHVSHSPLTIPALDLSYGEITVDSTSDDVKAAVRFINGSITNQIHAYTLAISLKIKHDTGNNIESARDNHGTTLIWINEMCDSISQFESELKSIITPSNPNTFFESFFNKSFGGFYSFISETSGAFWSTENEVRLMLKEVSNSYRTLVKEVGPGLSVEDSGYYVEKLTTLKRSNAPNLNPEYFGMEGWVVGDGGTLPLLKPVYLAMLASSAVYTPFKSKVGDEDYMQALANIAGGDLNNIESDEGVRQVVELFDQIKNYKKPLYYVNNIAFMDTVQSIYGTSYGTYVGSSYRATLGNLIDFCEKEIPTTFVTVKGAFKLQPDTSSWVFYQANPESSQDGVGNNIPSHPTILLGKSVVAIESLTTGDYTKTLFEVGNRAGTFSIGLMLFQNAYQDLRNVSAIDKKKSNLLYVNVLGDIVLNDNTVIVPGAANPLIYSPDSAYNPYTVAFMNSYPNIAQDSDSIKIQNKSDYGKYALVADKINNIIDDVMDPLGLVTSTNVPSEVVSAKNSDRIHFDRIVVRKIENDSKFSKSKDKMGLSLYPFFYGGPDSYYLLWNYASSDLKFSILPVLSKNSMKRMLVTVPAITNRQVNVFPYFSDINRALTDVSESSANDAGDSDFRIAKSIAMNMYWYYTKGSDLTPSNISGNGNLRQDYIISEFILEMLQGTEDVSVYERHIDVQSKVLGPDTDKVRSQLEEMSYALLKNVGDFDGVLGIKSSESDPLFGTIIRYARQYALYLVFLFLALFIFRYMRRGDFLYIVTMSSLSGLFVLLFIYVLPAYLPIVYNGISSAFTESIVSDTMLYKSEKYSTTYGLAGSLNSNNDYNMQTASLTLYHMSEEQIDMFCAQYNIDKDSFRYGDRLVIDPDIGMYLQGSYIKLNTDVLFANNPIYGAYQNVPSGVRYQLLNEKRASSSLDYYCPFYSLEDGLVNTLNSMLMAYNVPRATSNYVDGLVKDSFIMFNYSNSIPFLYGNDMSQINASLGITEYLKLEQAFPDPADFLNMRGWIENPSKEQKLTLWYKTMEKNGYYNPVGGAEKRADLVSYVNYHTKRYLINNQTSIGLISDENLIKVSSLMATFFFNTRISDFGTWVYPNGFNQEELKLNDVFVTALTSDNARYVKSNLDIVEYVGDSYGSLGLILLLVLVSICMIFVVTVKIALPLLYVVLLLLVVYRFVRDTEFGVLIKGYFKITGSVVGIYTLFIITITRLPKVMNGWSMLVVLMFVSLLLFMGLLTVILGFFKDLKSMGNHGILDALRRNPLLKPIANLLHNGYNSMVRSPQVNYNRSEESSESVFVEDPTGSEVATFGILDALEKYSDYSLISESPRFVFGKTVSERYSQENYNNPHIVMDSEGNTL